jgi:phosphoribosylamine--glycine ligase
MKILVIGSGGREHAIIWKLRQNKNIKKIYCAPGNGGIASLAECVNINAMDKEKIIEFSKLNKIDMVVVAPDDPLSIGMVDSLDKENIKAIGPVKEAAKLEWSKSYSKDFMKKYHIPTANYEVFDEPDEAILYLKRASFPIVIKASGLALGKGVIIANNYDEAKNSVYDIMKDKVFGDAGNEVVIEEFLQGPEITVLAFTDGKTIVPMVSSQDHKRAFDNDEGLNTGGMGTFSPSKVYTKELEKECMDKIYKPTINALNNEGIVYKGIIYFGLMLTDDGIKVIEYNSRFGDPEAQVILPRLKTDLVDVFEAIYNEKLHEINFEWDERPAICVIAASGGYPIKYEKGYEIFGLEKFNNLKDTIIFHAGTKYENNLYYTNGGRVFGLTVMAESIDDARIKAYDMIKDIKFEGMHYRKDIGIKK